MRDTSVETGANATELGFLAGGGEMAALIAALDWSRTPLGPMADWPQSLKTVVALMLASPGPVSVLWGADRIQLYNDAYIPIAADRHPAALGRPAAETWAEAYDDFLGPVFDRVFAGGVEVIEERTIRLRKRGGEGFEDRVFTASFSPLRDESGAVAGIFHPLLETTVGTRTEVALRETSRRLDAVLDNTRMAVFLMDHRQHCVYANAAAEQLTGYSFAEMQGRPLHDVIHHKHPDGRDYPLEDCPIDRAFPDDFQVEGEETFVHKDGSFYPVAFTASPIRDEASQTVGTVIEVRGIAEEKAREAALRESERALQSERDRLYALFEHAPGLVAVAHGPDHVFALANQAYRKLIGDRELVGRPVREALPELIEQGFVDLLDGVYRTGEPFIGHAMPTRVGLTDPEERFFDFVYQPILEGDGSVSGIFAQGFDVTERVLFQSQQKLLLDELNHRVKNNLATVQSIAYQTARHAPDLPTFRKTFDSRLVALSRTHDVLTASSWESADLQAVLEAELGPYGESRVRLEGPPIRLNPQQALALGLVIHELATNAAKYGALSGEDDGCVRVTWSDGEGRLNLLWNETDGPAVTPPERRGFGSRLIERGVQEMGGTVQKDWRPEGLDCRIEIPL